MTGSSASDGNADDDGTDPVEQLLDLFVYIPIGIALEAREQLPKLAERGRSQVAIARVLGRFAAQKGQNEAEKFVKSAADGLRDVVAPTGAGADEAAARASDTDDSSGDTDIGPDQPIASYDELTASEIVKKLKALDQGQLEAVAAYESAGRGRVTILNRVAQLRD